MISVATEYQHIHTDDSWSEAAFLEKVTTESVRVPAPGKLLVDVKPLTEPCNCTRPQEAKGWLIIYYYVA